MRRNPHTRQALRYGRALYKKGWRFKTHRFINPPIGSSWADCEAEVYGRVNGRYKLIEVAYTLRAKDTVKAACIWHELGHVDQLESVGRGWLNLRQLNAGQVFQEEVDAWHRGLAIAGEYGFSLDVDAAKLVVECLGSYMVDPEEFLREPLIQECIRIVGRPLLIERAY